MERKGSSRLLLNVVFPNVPLEAPDTPAPGSAPSPGIAPSSDPAPAFSP